MEYVASSTARLTSQLKSVQGWAELVFVSASIELSLPSNLETVRCSAVTAKDCCSITKNSSACAYSQYIVWNETETFPCCLDWDIQFSITAKSNRDKGIVAVTDVILIQSTGKINLPLRVGAKCVGELEVSLVFHPNQRSFKYLSIGCYLSEQLSYTLTNDILKTLNRNSGSVGDSLQSISSEEDAANIITAADRFTTFLTEENVYQSELCLALNIQSENEGKARTTPSDSRYPRSYDALLHKRQVNTPKLVPVHRAVSGAKKFLSRLLENVAQAPPVATDLVEKLLNIYTQALFITSSRAVPAAAAHAAAQAGEEAEMSLTWSQFAQLCVVCALWFLQQAVAALQLLSQCPNLTLPEYAALRFGFSQYDNDLSGCIQSTDLQSLLQDMGQDYTEAEIGLTVCFLDPDNLGTVAFDEFVRWWCE